MTEVPSPFSIDPTLVGPGVSDDWSYNGPHREIDPIIDTYVQNPGSLSDFERQKALTEAKRQTAIDAMQNQTIVSLNSESYWANEYPHVFTFDGTIRGEFEYFHRDPTLRSDGERILGPRGESTHTIIETDDGHMFVIRRTNDRKSAAKQTFELSSTTKHMGKGDNKIERQGIHTEQLKDVVVRPGLPLMLGKDPTSGRQLRTRGSVVRITTIKRNEGGKVASGHPFLDRPEMFRDTPARFVEAVRIARTMDAASHIGPLVTRQ